MGYSRALHVRSHESSFISQSTVHKRYIFSETESSHEFTFLFCSHEQKILTDIQRHAHALARPNTKTHTHIHGTEYSLRIRVFIQWALILRIRTNWTRPIRVDVSVRSERPSKQANSSALEWEDHSRMYVHVLYIPERRLFVYFFVFIRVNSWAPEQKRTLHACM